MVGHAKQDQGFLVADAAVHGARRLGCLGGVLGYVRGDGLFGDLFAVAEGADGLDVELGAPAQVTGG